MHYKTPSDGGVSGKQEINPVVRAGADFQPNLNDVKPVNYVSRDELLGDVCGTASGGHAVGLRITKRPTCCERRRAASGRVLFCTCTATVLMYMGPEIQLGCNRVYVFFWSEVSIGH